jgi:hypothetical protein
VRMSCLGSDFASSPLDISISIVIKRSQDSHQKHARTSSSVRENPIREDCITAPKN